MVIYGGKKKGWTKGEQGHGGMNDGLFFVGPKHRQAIPPQLCASHRDGGGARYPTGALCCWGTVPLALGRVVCCPLL